MLVAPVADVPPPVESGAGSYHVVDRRELHGGGVGLFIVVPAGLPREGIETVGEQLRARYREQSNVIAEIFDDVEAAKTVRTGSRLVGEERFKVALAHQRASYQKNVKTGRHVLIVRGVPGETIVY